MMEAAGFDLYREDDLIQSFHTVNPQPPHNTSTIYGCWRLI